MEKNTKGMVTKVVFTVVMAFISLIIIVPLLIMLLGSVKTAGEAQQFKLSLPTEWHFENYIHVFNAGGIGRALMNSLIVTISVTVFTVFTGGLCAFVLSRRSGKYTTVLYRVFLLGMISPLQIVTTFALLKLLNLMGSYLGVILVMTATQLPWTVFLFTGFIKAIPRELDEAAYIDGAHPIIMFVCIILPLLKPILATTVVSTAMAAWNEFMVPLYFFSTSSKWTMPLTVYNFFGQYQSSWNYVFANLVLTALPITLLYLYAQKYVIEGATAGAVKG